MKSGVRYCFSFLSFVWRATIGRGHRIYYLKLERQFIQTASLEMARIEPYLHISHISQTLNWYLLTDFFEFPSVFYRFNEKNRRFAFDPRKSEFINLGLSVECAAFESLKFLKLLRGVQRPILLAKRTLSSLYRGLEVKSDTDKCSLVINAAV